MSASRVRPRESDEIEEAGLPVKKQRTTFESSQVSKMLFEVNEFQSTIRSVFTREHGPIRSVFTGEDWTFRFVRITKKPEPSITLSTNRVIPSDIRVNGIDPLTLVNIVTQTWEFNHWGHVITFLDDAERMLIELEKNPDSRIIESINSTLTMIAQKIPYLVQLRASGSICEATPLEKEFGTRFKKLYQEAIDAGLVFLRVDMSNTSPVNFSFYERSVTGISDSPNYSPLPPNYSPTSPNYSPTPAFD